MNFDEGLDPVELAAAIGERLRAFRAEHGLSQLDVAERTGIARELINRYEAGKVLPSLRHFAILVRFMDTDPSWMLYGETEDVRTLVKERLLLKYFLAIQSLDPDNRRLFIDLADALIRGGKAARKAQFEKLFEEL